MPYVDGQRGKGFEWIDLYLVIYRNIESRSTRVFREQEWKSDGDVTGCNVLILSTRSTIPRVGSGRVRSVGAGMGKND